MSDNYLQLNQVCCEFVLENGDVNPVLRELDLSVKKGEFVSIIGSNGAGKSTLFNVIAGSVPCQKGTLTLDNKQLENEAEYLRSRYMARLHQEPLAGTAGQMTLEDNMLIAFVKGNKTLRRSLTKQRREYFQEIISRLNQGLEHRLKENMSTFSGGQRQALTLLMNTMVSPKLLLLDEHTAALDPNNAHRIMELTEEIVRSQQLTTLMVTHNMKYAIDYGDRLIMLDRGKVLLDFAGEEKKRLSIEDLLHQFKEVKNAQIDISDELILG